MSSLFTIGHSTHTLEEFEALLAAHQITHLVDVRSIPKSRHVPWFNSDTLAKALAKKKIRYSHKLALGGLRKAKKDSINLGWHNASFRGYADYMQTSAFAAALEDLIKLIASSESRVAIMCAEALPWRCHRSLIADALVARGIPSFHIMNMKSPYPHELTSFAKIDKSVKPYRVYYPEIPAK